MGGMDPDMVMPMEWTGKLFAVMFLMWWIMMIAMMVPSAAPMILLFATVNRRQRGAMAAPWVPTGIFAAGYLAAWAAYSGLATGLQWLLDQSGLMTMAMASAADWLGAVLLLGGRRLAAHAAEARLPGALPEPFRICQPALAPGRAGAFRMGLQHGSYCVACCWAVMGLLFYAGVMNLYWIVGLAVLVLLEKILPQGHGLGSLSGIGFLAWGAFVLAEPVRQLLGGA